LNLKTLTKVPIAGTYKGSFFVVLKYYRVISCKAVCQNELFLVKIKNIRQTGDRISNRVEI
jgi:hypothetical protein